jgi:hypothetical protein
MYGKAGYRLNAPSGEFPFNEQTGVNPLWKRPDQCHWVMIHRSSRDYLSATKIRRLEQKERRTVLRDNMVDKS